MQVLILLSHFVQSSHLIRSNNSSRKLIVKICSNSGIKENGKAEIKFMIDHESDEPDRDGEAVSNPDLTTTESSGDICVIITLSCDPPLSTGNDVVDVLPVLTLPMLLLQAQGTTDAYESDRDVFDRYVLHSREHNREQCSGECYGELSNPTYTVLNTTFPINPHGTLASY